MIKRFSIYLAFFAAMVVCGLGFYVGVAFDTIIIRTLLAFIVFYFLGTLLGVVTIEALLENQIQKVNRAHKSKGPKSSEGTNELGDE
jgi:F0F1-type ATP synthase assembly protein I